MALYFGSEKIKINLNGIIYYLNLFSKSPIINGAMLLSSDNYVLRDKNGLYLVVKKGGDE